MRQEPEYLQERGRACGACNDVAVLGHRCAIKYRPCGLKRPGACCPADPAKWRPVVYRKEALI